MNDRIKELYEQAHIERHQEYFSSVIDPTITSISVTRHFDYEKFAELIVRECAWVCEHRYSHNHKDLSEGAFAVIACSDAILEHFGVEE